jgi:hypothetical protein
VAYPLNEEEVIGLLSGPFDMVAAADTLEQYNSTFDCTVESVKLQEKSNKGKSKK